MFDTLPCIEAEADADEGIENGLSFTEDSVLSKLLMGLECHWNGSVILTSAAIACVQDLNVSRFRKFKTRTRPKEAEVMYQHLSKKPDVCTSTYLYGGVMLGMVKEVTLTALI